MREPYSVIPLFLRLSVRLSVRLSSVCPSTSVRGYMYFRYDAKIHGFLLYSFRILYKILLQQEKLQEMIWFEIIFILKQIFVIYVLKCSCQNDKIWLISC